MWRQVTHGSYAQYFNRNECITRTHQQETDAGRLLWHPVTLTTNRSVDGVQLRKNWTVFDGELSASMPMPLNVVTLTSELMTLKTRSVHCPDISSICVSVDSNPVSGSRDIKFTQFLWPLALLPDLDLWTHNLQNVISFTWTWYK